MTWVDVSQADGCWRAAIAGEYRPILLNSQPVKTFGAGWRPRGLYTAIEPFYLLDLCSDAGESGYWLLDCRLNFVTNRLTDVPAEAQGEFRQALDDGLAPIIRTAVAEPLAGRANIADFYTLPRSTRLAMLAMRPDHGLPPLRWVDLTSCPDDRWTISAASGDAVVIHKDQLLDVIGSNVSAICLSAFQAQRLTWPCLCSDGSTGKTENVRCLFFSEHLGVARCTIPGTSIVYYVILYGAPITAVGIFIPAAGLVFMYGGGLGPQFIGHMGDDPGQFLWALVDYLLGCSSAILRFLETPPTELATFMWSAEKALIGHYLWNELPGLEALALRVPAANLPDIFALGASRGAEFYGPVETLFPEFTGRVIRSHSDVLSAQEFCYKTGKQALLLNYRYVSAGVRNRVLNAASADPTVRMISDLATTDPGGCDSRKGIGSAPVIVLGLRVVSRTHVHLGQFYCKVLERLLQHTPLLTVVIDGHNSQPGGSPGRTLLSLNVGGWSPLELEQAIVEEIRAFANGRDVRVVSCVGSPMLLNLYWINRSIMFVAPWGAGLAKYRWVCNKPGVVFSSKVNLRYSKGLGIYHEKIHMEDPTPLHFVDPEWVIDIPTHPAQVAEAKEAKERGELPGISTVCFEFIDDSVLDLISSVFLSNLAQSRIILSNRASSR